MNVKREIQILQHSSLDHEKIIFVNYVTTEFSKQSSPFLYPEQDTGFDSGKYWPQNWRFVIMIGCIELKITKTVSNFLFFIGEYQLMLVWSIIENTLICHIYHHWSIGFDKCRFPFLKLALNFQANIAPSAQPFRSNCISLLTWH